MNMDTTKYKPYPGYKESGVEWLGEVPEHWEVKPIKRIASSNNDVLTEKTPDEYEIEYVDISSVNEVEGIVKTEEMIFKNAPSRARRLVRDGDIIISTVRTYLKAIAPIKSPNENLVVSTGFAVIRPNKELLPAFAAYLFKARYLIELIISRSVGVSYPAINSSDLVALKTVVPSLKEQQTIAAFLDRETAKIDTLIAKQERLIELLAEKRTALISHAVTKGLNPDVPMKDSGVEWLGEVPAHWEVNRFKFFCILQRGYDLSSDNFLNGTYPVCASNGIIGYHNQFNVRGPSITVGRSGSVGEVNYIDSDFWAHNTALYTRDFFDSTPKFVYYLLLSIDLKSLSAGSAVGTLNRNYIHRLITVFPPISEQQTIAAFLDRETAKIDTLIAKARRTIDLLKERRTALISAAVTGKIDVREIVQSDDEKPLSRLRERGGGEGA